LDLNVFRNADGNILAVGEEKLAVVSGSGKDVVFVLLAQDPAVRGAPKFALRSDSVVTELLWSETSSSRLATGHESGVVRVWDVASGALEQDLSAPVLELRGAHKKKVVSLAWSPVASDVLASAGGELAVVWSEAEPRFVLSHPAAVFSVAWSPDGALLLTTCADKKTRIWDPRSSVSAPVLEYSSCHDGVKPATGLFVSQDAVLTAGFNKNRERQLQLWSVKENKQLAKSTMDSGTGVLTLLFDPGSGLVFVSGKSDASIKVKTCCECFSFSFFGAGQKKKKRCLKPATIGTFFKPLTVAEIRPFPSFRWRSCPSVRLE
jgi:coronin-1B/1C/6